MTKHDDLVAPMPDAGRGTVSFILLASLFVCALGAWTWYGTLDIVSATVGEVVPGSKVRQIQHLEGGIVSDIRVQEREVVESGQILVTLDSTQIDAEVAELQSRLTSLRIDIVRLEAELAGNNAAVYPDDLVQRVPTQIEAARALMETRRKRLAAEFNVQRQLIAQRRQEIVEVSARLDTAEATRGFLDEQIKISDTLLKQNITNRMTHINLLKDLATLDGQVKEDRALLQRTHAALEEARAKLSEIAERFTEEGRSELTTARREFDELTERLRKFQDSQSRMVIRSPVAGIVKTVAVSTVGGVIRPGDVLAEIVPLDDRLVIDARMPLEDIGFVRTGQRAQITLTSADAARFGKLEGTVAGVSPDALLDDEGVPYYSVRIEPDAQGFNDGDLEYRLYPGLRVASSIVIGERRIAQYILDPYVSSMRAAMRER
ncbi:MAG: HlyD family type I secretion periplasmic adaptor subunit [Alphaproteobacteria bacterium]|uniref:HlyD family type I secretion periplasmic adaptor subunit n=1 Tax=Pacificispira sp. TaxID=2888761 RepID=UPI001B0940D5|nr:HlyD family type I secretion periplasmic adaptor subunit [Alphaproteobacteria bacterium]MBO6863314.1 HlyD family type I secretion periplasmic adaptor subunit [Alphaproteobacteria bacterium]